MHWKNLLNYLVSEILGIQHLILPIYYFALLFLEYICPFFFSNIIVVYLG